MHPLRTLLRLTRVELLKFRSKSVAWLAVTLLFIFPIGAEVWLTSISRRDAVFPRVAYLLLGGEVMLTVALTAIMVSVMTLGNDFELGIVRFIVSRGVKRYSSFCPRFSPPSSLRWLTGSRTYLALSWRPLSLTQCSATSRWPRQPVPTWDGARWGVWGLSA
jgi:hypothetical protein